MMTELTNLRRSYCYKCHRLLGYKPADRVTLDVPRALCFYCEREQEKQIAKYQEIGKAFIDRTCDVFLIVAGICVVLWVLHYIVG